MLGEKVYFYINILKEKIIKRLILDYLTALADIACLPTFPQ